MTLSTTGILISIVLYLGIVLYIGFRCSKKNKTTDDFYLGGRKLGPLVTAMSAEASDMSSYLLMGLPGLAYLTGLADVTWTAIGLAIGTYLNFLIVAKRLRRYSHELNAITIPDFFSFRYGSKSLMTIAAVVIIIFFVPYTASGFAACGKLFSSLFGVDYMTAMIISAVVILFYTCSGGFLAASITDLIQSILMTVALLVILFFGISRAGGIGAVIENAKSLPGFLEMFQTHADGQAAAYGPITVVSTMAWGLGYFGMPHILLRFMAIKDEEKLAVSRRIGAIWVVFAMGIAILIGFVGRALSANGSIAALTGSQTENVIVKIADLLSQLGFIPALVAGIVLAGILASTMSTADSQLLCAASGVSKNLLGDICGLKLSAKSSMWVARGTLLVISILAMFIARDPDSNIFSIVSFAWAGFGAAFGPVILFALFWKRSNKQGALAGMVTGGAVVFLWKYLVRPMGGAWNIYELLPAFIAASIAIVVVSLLTKKPDEEILSIFNKVNEK